MNRILPAALLTDMCAENHAHRGYLMCMTSRTLCSAAIPLVVCSVLSVLLSAQSPWELQPLDTTGTVTYFIGNGEPESTYRRSDRDLATWALQAWERSIDGRLRFEPSSENEALIRVYWVTPDTGLYGEMQPLTVNGRRGAAVYVRTDTDVGGEKIAQLARTDPLFRDSVVYLTCLHEIGHALGLTHTNNIADIMYFFGFGGDIPGFFNRYRMRIADRNNIAEISGLSTNDINRIRTLYPRP